VLLRWLLPVVAVLAFLASSVTAFAASGILGDTACCCPDPDTCKCHDHDGKPDPAAKMKRCGGDARLVTAQLTPALAVAPAMPELATRVVEELIHSTLPMPPARHDRPEKPPS